MFINDETMVSDSMSDEFLGAMMDASDLLDPGWTATYAELCDIEKMYYGK